MDKNTIAGIERLVYLAVGGYLLYGWRGAVVSVLFGKVVSGLLQDAVDAATALTKYHIGANRKG